MHVSNANAVNSAVLAQATRPASAPQPPAKSDVEESASNRPSPKTAPAGRLDIKV
jgi:hypothetical protein